MRRIKPFGAAVVLLSLVLGAACDPSDLRAKLQGNRDIPEAWQALVPESVREDLIDAEIGDDQIKLRYHEGKWSDIVAAVGESATSSGYTRVGSCPSSDGDPNGSVLYAKPAEKGAQMVQASLSTYIKSNGHFFIEVRKNELAIVSLPDGCTFSDAASELCQDFDGKVCSFKGKG